VIRLLNHYADGRRTVHAATGVIARKGSIKVVWASTACGAVEGDGISRPFTGHREHVTCEACRTSLENDGTSHPQGSRPRHGLAGPTPLAP
jgi:hypothetical protein